jgi:IS5 family transposase
MNPLVTWAFQETYRNQKSRNRLLQISDFVDWQPIRLILEKMYDNKSEKGGRPNFDVILMFKILILEEWYGLNDQEVERQITDRISFMGFLGFPTSIPDSSTIWLFKERLKDTGSHKLVWDEFQSQLDAKGLTIKRGTIQDATFIEADPGSSKLPRGDGARTRRSKDGTWAKKGNESHFGFKWSSILDMDYWLIRNIETTTAKLHDSQVDLSIPGIPVLRDRGYFGAPARGEDFTMKRRTTDRPLDQIDKERNQLISKLRSPGERPFAVIKRIFGAGRVMVTTVERVAVKMTIAAIAYNLFQMCTLKNARII